MRKTERAILTGLASMVPKGGIIVELGSYLGDSSKAIAKGIRAGDNQATLFCVDTWRGVWAKVEDGKTDAERAMAQTLLHTDARVTFESNMTGIPHVTLQMSTDQAVSKFRDGSVDMIFIDADHSYDAVRADILNWMPKLKPGAFLCGHDYRNYEGVTKAVEETVGAFSVRETIWLRD